MEFTNEEIRSLLYYQGAVENIALKPNELNLKAFYSVDNAYEAINMLMFDDIESEKVRLYKEKRRISPDILDHVPELLDVYCNIYSAICKYTYQNTNRNAVHTYRDDRNYTYAHMKRYGKNESFLSCTLNSQKKENVFQNKENLTFFEFVAGTDIEYLEMNKVLGKMSAYPGEEEVLFPPFLEVHLKEEKMTEIEKTLKGLNGTVPIGKYTVTFGKSTITPQCMTEGLEVELGKMQKMIWDSDEIKNAKEVWQNVAEGKEDDARQSRYIEWKKMIQSYISKCYAVIKWNVLNEDGRKKRFLEDIKCRENQANRNRMKYEKRLFAFYGAEVVVGTLAGLFLALSMTDSARNIFQILTLLMLAVFSIVAGFCKITSVGKKFIQRTDIFLKYDELLEHWEYEEYQDYKTLNLYIERMLEIAMLDNQYCKDYTGKMVEEKEAWEKKIGKMEKS